DPRRDGGADREQCSRRAAGKCPALLRQPAGVGIRRACVAARRARRVTPPDIRAANAPRPDFAPRVLILDLDGTSISRGAFLHPRTEAAVRAATEQRAVVIATGRQYISALPWAQRMGVPQPIVCFEGAVIRT